MQQRKQLHIQFNLPKLEKSQLFYWLININQFDQLKSTTFELSAVLSRVLNSKAKSMFLRKFEEYEDVSDQQYLENQKLRINCFTEFSDNDLIEFVRNDLPPNFDLSEILYPLFQSFQSKKSINVGLLFLTGLIARYYPQQIQISKFEIFEKTFTKASPLICWIIGNSLIENQTIDFQLIFQLFLQLFEDNDIDSWPSSVNAAFLLHESFIQYPRIELTSHLFFSYFELILKQESNRDRKISSLLNPFLAKIEVPDLENLPQIFFSKHPECPHSVQKLFVRLTQNDKFVAGWLTVHEANANVSKRYLKKLSDHISPKVLRQFPEKDLLHSGEIPQLLHLQNELNRSSIIFSGVLLVASFLYFLTK